MNLFSFALGIGTKDTCDNWLEVFYPQPLINPDAADLQSIISTLEYKGGNHCIELTKGQFKKLLESTANINSPLIDLLSQLAASTKPVVAMFIEEDRKPESVPEIYLKLQLLSHRLIKPHGTNLDGMFALLPNVAWTNRGAIAVNEVAQHQLNARLQGELLEIMSVDKFPKMTNYVVPAGVRIAHTARVRLGAYIGSGTTIMHEGFVNFNAGTEAQAMIEGRITAGVVVGDNSDLGGGCSILGTLSGGGKELISIGKNCLIGANAGLGFSLGDRCTIEAGLYVTAGTKVTVLDNDNQPVHIVKARELSHQDDMLFIRNSTTGVVECRTNKSKIELNDELHAHN